MTEEKATSPAQWRANKAHPFTLPSDNVIKLKRVHIMDLIVQGSIPDTLSAMAVEVASKTSVKPMTMDELKAFGGVVALVVKATAVEPRVTDTPTDETLGINEIDFVDQTAIFNWANGTANALRPFRPGAKA